MNHLAFWKEIGAGALTGAPRRPGPIVNSETFGPPGDPADEAAWQEALARLRAAHAALRAAVAGLTDADLDQPLPGEDTTREELVLGLIAHDAYHLGQIVLIRKLAEAAAGGAGA
ncbi:MAG: DinB family protein [Bacillota bacterium]